MLKKIIVAFSVLIFGVAANCEAPPNGSEPVNNEPVVVSGTDCAAAQKHLENLCAKNPTVNQYCCQIVKPTKKGKSFLQFCLETQDAGIDLNTKCLVTITSCNQIDICLGIKK